MCSTKARRGSLVSSRLPPANLSILASALVACTSDEPFVHALSWPAKPQTRISFPCPALLCPGHSFPTSTGIKNLHAVCTCAVLEKFGPNQRKCLTPSRRACLSNEASSPGSSRRARLCPCRWGGSLNRQPTSPHVRDKRDRLVRRPLFVNSFGSAPASPHSRRTS